MSYSFMVMQQGKLVATIDKQFGTPDAPAVWVLKSVRGQHYQFTTMAAAQSSARRRWTGASFKSAASLAPRRRYRYGSSFGNAV